MEENLHREVLYPTGEIAENRYPGVDDVPEWTKGDRMRRALRHADISVSHMALDMGVSVATIGRWLNDRGPVKPYVLKVWAMTTGTSLEWLETGQVPSEPFMPESLGSLERARRDSNPQPFDREPARLLLAWSVKPGLTPDRTAEPERARHLRAVS